MKPGEGRSSWRERRAQAWARWRRVPAFLARALLVCALAGCATDRATVEKNLLAVRSAGPATGIAEQYRVGCADVLEVRMPNRPELSGQHVVAPTGRIDLGDYAPLRVEGRTLPEIAGMLATETGQAPADVAVRIAEYRSQYLLLTGQVSGWQRTVPYRGQETVLDLLQRVGGITSGAELGDVYVVRTHMEEGKRPEVFHVNLQAIVMKHDDRTNLRLLPFDQVYIGESRQAQMERALPPWLRPIYQAFWSMLPDHAHPASAPRPPESRWMAGS
jgi:protein involved in polysaccharide export with SLBB domain